MNHPIYPNISIPDKETWKGIPGHTKYEASTYGRIRSIPRSITIRRKNYRPGTYTVVRKGRLLKIDWGNTYMEVSLGRGFHYSVHYLILITFVGPRPKGMECRHLDGNSKNNRLENLSWGTGVEQHQDKIKHGTLNYLRGEKCSYAKLTTQKILEIRRLYATGNYSQWQIGKMFGLHQVTISNIVLKKIWGHV